MKALIFSDVEVHPYKQFGSGQRLDRCIEVIEKAFKTASENRCDVIMFCGDLTDQPSQMPTSVVNRLTDLFARCFKDYGIPFISISGNHDQPKKYRGLEKQQTTQDFLDLSFEDFHLIDNRKIKVRDFVVGGIPYYDERFPENFLQAWDKLGDMDIRLIHQTPSELDVPYDTIEIPNSKGITFCGHIHEAKELRSDLIIVGAALSKSFGDSGDRYFWVVEFDKSLPDLHFIGGIEKIETGMPKFGEDYVREKKEFETRVATIDVNLSDREMLKQFAGSDSEAKKFIDYGFKCLN